MLTATSIVTVTTIKYQKPLAVSMTIEQGVLDWGSFFIGVVFTSGVVILLDLIRSRRSLRLAQIEINELKKKLKTKREKGKGKKS